MVNTIQRGPEDYKDLLASATIKSHLSCLEDKTESLFNSLQLRRIEAQITMRPSTFVLVVLSAMASGIVADDICPPNKRSEGNPCATAGQNSCAVNNENWVVMFPR